VWIRIWAREYADQFFEDEAMPIVESFGFDLSRLASPSP
jgi:hypothetical protein